MLYCIFEVRCTQATFQWMDTAAVHWRPLNSGEEFCQHPAHRPFFLRTTVSTTTVIVEVASVVALLLIKRMADKMDPVTILWGLQLEIGSCVAGHRIPMLPFLCHEREAAIVYWRVAHVWQALISCHTPQYYMASV